MNSGNLLVTITSNMSYKNYNIVLPFYFDCVPVLLWFYRTFPSIVLSLSFE